MGAGEDRKWPFSGCLVMTSDLGCQRGQPCGVLSTGPSTIERSEPAQVARAVGTGHASEAAQPLRESTRAGVDVLDLPRAAHSLAFPQVTCWCSMSSARAALASRPLPSVYSRAPSATARAITALTAVLSVAAGHTKSAVCPVRARSTRIGICSLKRPRLRALPPRRWLGRCSSARAYDRGWQKVVGCNARETGTAGYHLLRPGDLPWACRCYPAVLGFRTFRFDAFCRPRSERCPLSDSSRSARRPRRHRATPDPRSWPGTAGIDGISPGCGPARRSRARPCGSWLTSSRYG